MHSFGGDSIIAHLEICKELTTVKAEHMFRGRDDCDRSIGHTDKSKS